MRVLTPDSRLESVDAGLDASDQYNRIGAGSWNSSECWAYELVYVREGTVDLKSQYQHQLILSIYIKHSFSSNSEIFYKELS